MLNLKPSNIFFSQNQISATFGKWNKHRNKCIGETLDDLCDGRCKVSDIETIKVVKKDGKWVTIDNRRLWVFHHLEAAGKCDTIPVTEVQYSSITHGRKFDSTNGGKSVKIIKGRSPGGRWHMCITPVIPQIIQDKCIESKNVNKAVKSSNELEYKSTNRLDHLNKCIDHHSTLQTTSRVFLFEDKPDSLLTTSTKNEKNIYEKNYLTCSNETAESGYKFSIKDKSIFSPSSILSSGNQPKLFTQSNLIRSSFCIPSTRSFTTTTHKIPRRFKPYDLTSKRYNSIRFDLSKNTYIERYPSKSIDSKLNPSKIKQKSSDVSDIESGNDWSEDEFSIFVDERENSDYEDTQMSISDDESREIDYGDDTWSDIDEKNADNDAEEEEKTDDDDDDDDDDYDINVDDNNDYEEDDEKDIEYKELQNENDDDDAACKEGKEESKKEEEEKGNKDIEDRNKEEKNNKEEDIWEHTYKSKYESLLHSTDTNKAVSYMNIFSEEMTRKLRHIWTGQPLADLNVFDSNYLTTPKRNKSSFDKPFDLPNDYEAHDKKYTWSCTLQPGKIKIKKIKLSKRKRLNSVKKTFLRLTRDYEEYKASEKANNDDNLSEQGYDSDDTNAFKINRDLTDEERSYLEYDELDVWPDDLKDDSKYIISNVFDSSDSDPEDDFLVAKEVEINEKGKDNLHSSSEKSTDTSDIEDKEESISGSDIEDEEESISGSDIEDEEESINDSDIEDDETVRLNEHYVFEDKDERRQRARKISEKMYIFPLFPFDQI